MTILRQLFLVLTACLVSTSAFTAHAEAREKWLFYKLATHPRFETTVYTDQAVILKRGEIFHAAFAVVRSETSSLVCAYAAAFDPFIGQQPGTYVLKPRYICDDATKLVPYEGYFAVKYPPCGGQVCANPAIGVGNLIIRPEFEMSLARLPLELRVTIDGRINEQPFDGSLPVAGDF